MTRDQFVRVLLIGLVLAAATIRAQTPEQTAPTFDVASIKLNTSGDPQSGTHDLPGGRVTMTNLRLRDVIRRAYGSTDLDVMGGPSWLDTDRWDIVAAAASGLSDASWQLMMKTLLADRCRLLAHTERREQPIFRLVFARLGLKLEGAKGLIDVLVIDRVERPTPD